MSAGATGTRPGHLLVASRGPWSGPGADRFLVDAAALAGTGAPVTVLLLADAAPFAAPGGGPAGLVALLAAGGRVWVDRFSAAQRGLGGICLPPGVEWVDAEDVAGPLLDPGVRVVWH